MKIKIVPIISVLFIDLTIVSKVLYFFIRTRNIFIHFVVLYKTCLNVYVLVYTVIKIL